jgi:hypothetical protein
MGKKVHVAVNFYRVVKCKYDDDYDDGLHVIGINVLYCIVLY